MAEIVWESESSGFTVMSNGMVWPDDWPGTLVEAQFTSARGDGADLDRDPDMVPSGPGRVTFTPLVRTVGYDGEHGKRIVSLHPFEAVVGDDGFLYTPDEYGQPGIRGIVLPSNDSVVVDEHDWTWRVTFDIPDTTIRPTHIPTPHDHSVDIKDYLDSDANYGVRVVVDTVAARETLKARDETIEARNEAVPAASTAVSARDAALAARDEALASKWFRAVLATSDDIDVLYKELDTGLYSVPTESRASIFGLPQPDVGTLEVQWVFGAVSPIAIHRWTTSKNSTWKRYYRNHVWSDWEIEGPAPYSRGYLIEGSDLDSYRSASFAGVWGVGTAARDTVTGTLPPEWGFGMVEIPAAAYAIQRFTPQAAEYSYERTLLNWVNNTWTTWRKIGAHDSDELEARLDALENGTTGTGSDPARLIAPLESRIDEIALWGDSNLQSGGTATRLRELLPDSTVNNYARSGQYAPIIAARQGGTPAMLTVQGGTIPATGPVAVGPLDLDDRLLYQTGRPALAIEGTLAGVHGTLSVAANTHDYTFTRTTPGEAVSLNGPTPFWADIGKQSRDKVSIFWVGGNNPERGVHEYNLAMAAHLTPAHKRFIVMPCINLWNETQGTQGYEDNMRNNRAGAEAFGERWLDHRTWLIENGLDALGITPTQQDLDAIAGDAMPYSLTSDGAHFIGSAQRLIGDLIYERMQLLGWVGSD